MSKEIIVFGTGLKADEEIPYIETKGYFVRYYLDNDSCKWGMKYKGKDIKSPEVLIEEKSRHTIVITSEKYKEEIFAQLIDLGVYYENDCLGLDDFEYRISNEEHNCSTIEKVKIEEDNISVLFDSQAFAMQKQGGISRYYYEIIKRIVMKRSSVSLFKGINDSCYDFEKYENALINYYSRLTDITNIEVRNAINAKLIQKFVGTNNDFDIYHPTYYSDYYVRSYKKLVVTVYDMIHERYMLDRLTPIRKKQIIDRADGVIAISNSTKNDLVEIYGIDDKKIKVIYLANSLELLENDEAIFDDYILFVGNRGGYKNGNLLLKAFAKSKCSKDYRLVFAGGGSFKSEEMCLIENLGITDRVMQVSCDDNTLANLYINATFFVYPTSYEGFGIPILESMHFGTPVITSRSSSLTEVAGDAALIFDVNNEEALIEAIEKMAGDSVMRNELVRRGIEREKQFSWDKCASETYGYYKKLLKG